MKKLKTWQIVLLVIFYPVGICVLIYRIWKKYDLKKKQAADEQARREREKQEAEEYRARIASDLASREKITFKVVGVTFKNEDGKSRQTILRKINFSEPPFKDDDELNADIIRTSYEGNPAFCVYVNNLQIGNIGKEDIPFFVERFGDFLGITSIDVYGGGTDDEGHPIHYGAKIDCEFRKRS